MKKRFALILVALLAPAVASADTVAVRISGLVCDLCIDGIEKHLHDVPGVRQSFVSLKDGVVAMDVDNAQAFITGAKAQSIKGALVSAGYQVHQISQTSISLATIEKNPKQAAARIWSGNSEQEELLKKTPADQQGETCGKKQAGFGVYDRSVWG